MVHLGFLLHQENWRGGKYNIKKLTLTFPREVQKLRAQSLNGNVRHEIIKTVQQALQLLLMTIVVWNTNVIIFHVL